jgi:hypothetical protein
MSDAGQTPIDGPEPWSTTQETVWSHWDLRFCNVARADHDGDLEKLTEAIENGGRLSAAGTAEATRGISLLAVRLCLREPVYCHSMRNRLRDGCRSSRRLGTELRAPPDASCQGQSVPGSPPAVRDQAAGRYVSRFASRSAALQEPNRRLTW